MTKLNLEQTFGGIYRGKTVFVTGHTGFKGGWLVLWLKALGAKVVGYSLAPERTPNLFNSVKIEDGITHIVGDVRNFDHVKKAMANAKPDFVFHLAAQPLVRQSYREPRETYETNVMGTVNVLESVRSTPSVRVCVNVTSDKCYENNGWVYPYRENDPMGGIDPYSSSKGAVEIVAAAYRRSFFNDNSTASLVSVRAGNVIGGGDWTPERIIPDCVKALADEKPIHVRNPLAVRPWQYVLEPLSGYLWLGSLLWTSLKPLDYGWNFGPLSHECLSVRDLVKQAIAAWGEGEYDEQSAADRANSPHEADLLRLDCSKAAFQLGWTPVYRTQEAIERTVLWYRNFYRNSKFDALDYSLSEINTYVEKAREQGLTWAKEPKRSPKKSSRVANPSSSRT